MAAQPKRKIFIRQDNIPDVLKQHPHWLMWRYEENTRSATGKPLKVPYYASGWKRGGVLGSAKDRKNLATFEEALAEAESNGFDGVGLAVLPEQDLTIIDLDGCIDDDGVYSDFAADVVGSGSYVERSPSGRGLRAVFEGALLENTKRNFHIENGERVEVYCGSAYVTFTGNKVSDAASVEPLPRSLSRVLRAGLESSGQTTGEGESAAGSEDGLVSMNARPIPNMTPAQALRVLQALPNKWGSSGEGTWFQVAAALHMQFDGSDEGYEVLDSWSQHRDGYDEEGNRRRWDAGFSHTRGKQNVLSMRNLVFEAREAGAKFKQSTLQSWGLKREAEAKAAEGDIELPEDALDEVSERAWTPVDLRDWATEERPAGVPALVKNWMYEGTVVLFSSHGGGGKSYVSLSFCALAASGGRWFGEEMRRGRVLYVSGEDGIAEVGHRLWGICSLYGLDMGGLSEQLHIVDVTPVLHKALYTAGTDYGKTEFTKQYRKLRELVETNGYKYVVVDNLSKFYMANENARPMVDEFISALAAMASQHGAGVLLVGHDAKAANAAGHGYSGSTAWHNSARARWALGSVNGQRTLMVEKNNYGSSGHGGTWEWNTEKSVMGMGSAVGEGTASSEFEQISNLETIRDIVTTLYAEGSWVAANTQRGPIGAITEHPWVIDRGFDASKVRELLEECVQSGLLEVEEYRTEQRKVKHRFAPPISSIV